MANTNTPFQPSRRLLLTSAAVTAACGVLGRPSPANAAKMSQKAALYQDTPKGDQRCDNCTLFLPDSGCKIVDGTIRPEGWCKFYVAKHV
jgi:hypothetical protein